MNMKKMLSLALAGVMALSLMACTAQSGSASSENTSAPSSVSQTAAEGQTPETVTITSLNANKEAAELEVPYDPQRIAILDMASLDILDALGVGDRVVGTADTSLEYLKDYINDDIANLGTIKEADLEAVMACEPDVIFIGGRLSSSYDALSEIAPVVYLATDTELGVVESVRQNATTIASMFGLEDKVDELMANFDARITALSEFAAGKTACRRQDRHRGTGHQRQLQCAGQRRPLLHDWTRNWLRKYWRGRQHRHLHPWQRGIF